MIKQFAIALVISLPMRLPAAFAADDHKGHDHAGGGKAHAHEAKAQYGGVVSVVNDMNYELVAKPEVITLYVSDHGKPVNVSNASASLTLLSGTEKTDATLSPAGGNKLESKGAFKVASGTKAVAVVKRTNQAPATARFTLK